MATTTHIKERGTRRRKSWLTRVVCCSWISGRRQALGMNFGLCRLQCKGPKQGKDGGYHKPSDFDKKILVWTKRYADVSQVPREVTNIQMKKAKDLFRIRVNLMMVAMTVVLAAAYAWSGRRAAQRGDSIVRQNRLWHAEGQDADNKA
ncbi:hypothetical protein BaRGS_00014157 [Batillaria attramentaria]|uniref:Uncharacterized protein n=1 Tax=Batillaria attramentaria TaxID=370345 RepID=A0ABD0L4N9_9CAEN